MKSKKKQYKTTAARKRSIAAMHTPKARAKAAASRAATLARKSNPNEVEIPLTAVPGKRKPPPANPRGPYGKKNNQPSTRERLIVRLLIAAVDELMKS